MKVVSSLKSKGSLRNRDNKIVRRRDGKGKMRLLVINKNAPRQKAKQ